MPAQKSFKGMPVDDAAVPSLTKLWNSIEDFVVNDLGDGFQPGDIYSLIVVVMNGLRVVFPDTAGASLKEYAVYLTNALIKDLIARNLLPAVVNEALEHIPVGTIVDLISAVSKGAFTGRFGATKAEAVDPDFVKRHWVLRH